MVERIIEQVFKIPEMMDFSGTGPRETAPMPAFDPKKYEELLATAVLNKVRPWNFMYLHVELFSNEIEKSLIKFETLFKLT